MSRRVPILVLVLLVASSLGVLTAISASNCMFSDNGFTATVSTSVYTGGPPVPFCLNGVPIVKVDVNIQGHGENVSTSQLRCGILSDPVTLSAAGFDHTVEPTSGNDWEDALTNCDNITYAASH